MLAAVVAGYLVIFFLSAAFVFPRFRNRVVTPVLRRLALAWGLLVLGYTFFSPACVYLPRVPAPAATRRILLGVDDGQLYWLEGTATRFAFAMGPRWWFYWQPHAGLGGIDMALEFVPPLRLARMNQREQRWELVRSDGRRSDYPPGPDGGYLGRYQVVVPGEAVVTEGMGEILRLDPISNTWTSVQKLGGETGSLVALARTDEGSVEVLERSKLSRDTRGKKRDILVRERDREGAVVRETRYVLDDWSRGPAGRAGRRLFAAGANGRVFLAQVALTELNEGFGKVFILPESGAPVELCSFAYERHLPLSFAVSPDGRYFSNGQAVLEIDGTVVMPLVPALRMVAWRGSSVVGVRSFPFVGLGLLRRDVYIRKMLAWARATEPEAMARLSPADFLFEIPQEALSRAVRRRPAWFGGLDDSGGADEIVSIEVR